MEVKYYICKHCGNIIEKINDTGVPVICCGEEMAELKAGVTDAAVEKHVPVYTVDGNKVNVGVGEAVGGDSEAHFRQVTGDHIHLILAVGLAGAVEDAHGLGFGERDGLPKRSAHRSS